MLEISNVKVYDLKESVIASGNAMRLEPVSYSDDEFEKGIERMKKLVRLSSKGDVKCHDNALVGIRVSFDVKYPQYWSPEFQRYHFADIVTSSSKMHRLLKMDIDKSCNEYVSSEIVERMRLNVLNWNYINDDKCEYPVKFSMRNGEVKIAENKNDALYYAWMKCISDCPMGLELFMRISTNYKQLQTIYNQRKKHKLREDWGALIKMIEDLPYSKGLILPN